jgi:hypothetical protein
MTNYLLTEYYSEFDSYIILKFVNKTSNNLTNKDLYYILNTLFNILGTNGDGLITRIRIFEIINDKKDSDIKVRPISKSLDFNSFIYDESMHDINHIFNCFKFNKNNVIDNIFVKIEFIGPWHL